VISPIERRRSFKSGRRRVEFGIENGRSEDVLRNRGKIWHEVSRTEFVKGEIGELGDTVLGGVGITGREGELGEFGSGEEIGLEIGESREDFRIGRVSFVVGDGELDKVGHGGRVGEKGRGRLGDEIEKLLGGDSGGSN